MLWPFYNGLCKSCVGQQPVDIGGHPVNYPFLPEFLKDERGNELLRLCMTAVKDLNGTGSPSFAVTRPIHTGENQDDCRGSIFLYTGVAIHILLKIRGLNVIKEETKVARRVRHSVSGTVHAIYLYGAGECQGYCRSGHH